MIFKQSLFSHIFQTKEDASMERPTEWAMLVLAFALVTATSLYAADQPASGSRAPEIPGNIPQTGDEVLAQKDADILRGKLLKTDGRLYTVETTPGGQVSLRAGKDTQFEAGYKGMEGDWIEALVTPDMHIESLKKSTPAYTLEGDVLKVEGDSVVMQGPAGKEIRLQIGKDTKVVGTRKVGERVRAEYTPDGKALSVKPAKIPRGPTGG
jgi:hypothetical protein